ncbi:Formyltransferase [Rhodotorula sp. JG-1b]|nr:Formyltransferase [Rhodotorula sp. JG-1b]
MLAKRPRLCSAPPLAVRWLSSTASTPPYRVLFFGADQFSCDVFQQLHAARKDLVEKCTVVTPPDQRVGRRGKDLHRPRLRLLAEELGVQTMALPEKSLLTGWEPPDAFLRSKRSPQNLLLTASFGHLIPTSLLAAHFEPLNALNVHPSLLPRWRGAAPIQWSILAGDWEGGVTVQELSRGRFDRGRILAQEQTRLAPDADFPTLERTLAQQGGRLLVSTLRHLAERQRLAVPQSNTGATHARKLTREDARVEWETKTAEEVCRMQRAIGHQHPLWTTFADDLVVQLDVESVPLLSSESSAPSAPAPAPGSLAFDPASRRLSIACRSGSVVVKRVKRQGGKGWIEAREWWAGNKSRFLK